MEVERKNKGCHNHRSVYVQYDVGKEDLFADHNIFVLFNSVGGVAGDAHHSLSSPQVLGMFYEAEADERLVPGAETVPGHAQDGRRLTDTAAVDWTRNCD